MVLDVDGAWAPLALDAPVEVDGQPARLQLRATKVRPPSGPVPPPSAGGRGGRLLADGEADLDGDALMRFEALRSWRSDQARTQQVPAYIVFNDTHLRELARRNPASLVELSRCPGVGPKKLDQYGDEVLEVLADASA